MAETSLDSEILNQLNSKLLDDIDKLRHFGVGNLVSLPQVIVVGDQSSGKSSVLEAISRVRFPVKSGVCTRFPTELALRRTEKEHVEVRVGEQSIREGEEVSIAQLPELIEEAKRIMGIPEGSKDFSQTILRVEISGPDRPSLTLVDLPGIYHSGTENQSQEGAGTVSALLERYMKQKNSIILAVISATNVHATQQILAKAKKIDEKRERTLGIVTKPDLLKAYSAEEVEYIKVIKNEESANKFDLGWHVLRNRDSKENDEINGGASRISDDERDERERQLFDSGIWRSLPSEIKGVTELRRRLNQVLTDHIRSSLPSVIVDMEEKLRNRQQALDRLGPARETSTDCRDYMFSIVEQFRDLTRAAVKGIYDDPFFNDPFPDSEATKQSQSNPRKLRAVIRNLNRAFDAVISESGSSRKIKWNEDENGLDVAMEGIPDTLKNWATLYEVKSPDEVLLSDLVKELEIKASNNLGTQFPGSPDDTLALHLFREQSSRWKDIASKHIRWTIEAARHFVERALIHVVKDDTHTLDNILRDCIEPGFRSFSTTLDYKMEEILRHYLTGEALCLEDEFHQRLSSRTKSRLADQVSDALLSEPELFSGKQNEKLKSDLIRQAVLSATNTETNSFGLERVIDISTVYYEMSLRTFVDNVIILAVENCLMHELPSLLTIKLIRDMDPETLLHIAGERPRIHQMRNELKREIAILENGLTLFKKSQPRALTSFPSVMISPARSRNSGPSTPSSSQAKTKLSGISQENLSKGDKTSSIFKGLTTSSIFKDLTPSNSEPISFNLEGITPPIKKEKSSSAPQSKLPEFPEKKFDFNDFTSKGKGSESSDLKIEDSKPSPFGSRKSKPSATAEPSLFGSTKLKESAVADGSASGEELPIRESKKSRLGSGMKDNSHQTQPHYENQLIRNPLLWFSEPDRGNPIPGHIVRYFHICCLPEYKERSPEEIRWNAISVVRSIHKQNL